MPEFLKLRYTRDTSSTLSDLVRIDQLCSDKSICNCFYGGIFLQSVLGIDFWYGAIGLVLLTGIFTVLGGMKGIMTISVIQAPILIIGAVTILVLGLIKVGGGGIIDGWQKLVEITSANGATNMHLFHFDKADRWYNEFPGASVFFAAAIIGLWYWCTDQHIVQRALAAKN